MMFQIMTEEEIKAADEQTLRERVRHLMAATGKLDMIVEGLRTMAPILRSIDELLYESRKLLVEISNHTKPRPKPAKKKPRRKTKRLGK